MTKRRIPVDDCDGPTKKRVRQYRICSAEECTNIAVKGGVCRRHGAKVSCSHEGCTNYAKSGGVCVRHGADYKRCSHEGCTNQAKKGGICRRHGAEAKKCSHNGCANVAQKGGTCVRHGAEVKEGDVVQKKVPPEDKKVTEKKVTRKPCSHEGCTKVCDRHGAKPKCSHEECTNIAIMEESAGAGLFGGLCIRHYNELILTANNNIPVAISDDSDDSGNVGKNIYNVSSSSPAPDNITSLPPVVDGEPKSNSAGMVDNAHVKYQIQQHSPMTAMLTRVKLEEDSNQDDQYQAMTQQTTNTINAGGGLQGDDPPNAPVTRTLAQRAHTLYEDIKGKLDSATDTNSNGKIFYGRLKHYFARKSQNDGLLLSDIERIKEFKERFESTNQKLLSDVEKIMELKESFESTNQKMKDIIKECENLPCTE